VDGADVRMTMKLALSLPMGDGTASAWLLSSPS
jgi:hypothetical protein